jgi:hypothetical protein
MPAATEELQVDEGSPVMSIPQYGDYQFDIYFDGLDGQLPKYPVDFASLERKAAETLPSWVYSYVAGGCGDEAQLRAIVAELDLLMAIDGFPTLADLRAAGAQRI